MAKVLLIDDNSDIHRFVRLQVGHAGHEFMGAVDGASARARAFGDRPDVILLDWMLRGDDGVELCREFKRDERTCLVPIILLTVRSSAKDKIVAFEAGADEYLTKPFHPGELLARINGVLRLRTLQRELKNVETARQTLGALSHHILNAVQIIMTAVEDALPDDNRGWGFRHTILAQARRINDVLDSLGRVLARGEVPITEYPGVKEGIVDIRDELTARPPES
jgi:DNA-binding response OmpR family regulator